MNFKDAFDKDCSKINVSDELINRTLMAAMTDDDNSHTMDNPHTMDNSHTMDNCKPYGTGKAGLKRMGKKSSHKGLSYIITAVAIAAAVTLCIISYNILLPSLNSSHSSPSSSTLKVYAGENNEELGKGGLSLAYSRNSADHASNIQAWGSQGHNQTMVLYFDLNLQLTDSTSQIRRITLSSSDENTHLLTREPVPDEIIENNYKISEEYGMQHSLFRPSADFGYHTFSLFNSKEKFLYIDHANGYSADYNDFEHLYISFCLYNQSSLKTQLTLTVEYEDGTTISRDYEATAYASELYMFIRELR